MTGKKIIAMRRARMVLEVLPGIEEANLLLKKGNYFGASPALDGARKRLDDDLAAPSIQSDLPKYQPAIYSFNRRIQNIKDEINRRTVAN